MTTREQLEIITAFADGKGVQRRSVDFAYKKYDHIPWEPVNDYNHTFNFEEYEYRIRVEPPSEEYAKEAAWAAWTTDPSAWVQSDGSLDFKVGWEAAKKYFTKP